jgi:hypothetical protein
MFDNGLIRSFCDLINYIFYLFEALVFFTFTHKISFQTLIYTQRLAAAAIAAAAAPLPDLPAIAAIADLPVIAAIAARPILLIAEPVAINSLAPV